MKNFIKIASSLIILLSCIISTTVTAQGLINNGAKIVITASSNIYIDGPTGNYTSQSNGVIIDDTGSTITLAGNWINNSSNTGFSSNGSTSLSDGVLTTYDNNNANEVDYNDAQKLYNTGENICIGRDGKMLAIERRQTIDGNDTTFLNLYTLKQQNYKLQITTEAMENSGLYAVVKDNYSTAINNTAVNMGGVTDVIFTINADPASYAANRFSIVFANQAVLPVIFTSVKAYRQQKDILVDWKTANELNIKDYEVEISASGINFTKAATLTAKTNNGVIASYSWIDVNASEGIHYYRIKSVDISGKVNYSSVTKVTIDKVSSEKKLVICGNSIKGNLVSLQLNNVEKGRYTVQLYSMTGQLIKKFSVVHNGGCSTQNFTIDSYLPSGKYQVQLTGKSINLTASLIKE